MNLKPLYLLVLVLVCTSFRFTDTPKITLWLIGDSTMAIKDPKTYPETGWGMPFVNFFDSTVVVDNRAKNGRSTRTFLTEGLWKPVTEQMKAGDYVFIQFGHNDEVATKKSFTTEAEFQANLEKYVRESRAKKAIPVLITPVTLRSFDAAGKLEDTHLVYSQIVKKVAQEQQVPFIDLNQKSQDLLVKFGVEPSAFLFNHLVPGEHPNYPQGKEDNTHFNEFGARKMAQLVLADIRTLLPNLASRIVHVKK